MEIKKICKDCPFCQISFFSEQEDNYIYCCSAPDYPGVDQPILGNLNDIVNLEICWFYSE
jgi:hypothetical protein